MKIMNWLKYRKYTRKAIKKREALLKFRSLNWMFGTSHLLFEDEKEFEIVNKLLKIGEENEQEAKNNKE